MTAETETRLELDDIQSGVLRPRPAPYAATYIVFRIDDRKAGRELMRRASAVVTSAANPTSPLADTWVSVALTYQGLQALGRAAGVARQLRLGVPAGHGRAREGAGGHRRERPRALGAPARDAGRPCRARRGRPGCAAARGGARARPRGVPGALAGDHRDLASGLPRAAHRDGAVRIPGRHQPSGHRRQRHPGDQPSGSAPEGRRVRARLSRRAGRHPADQPRDPRPQRHLRRLPQAAPARGGVPPVSDGERDQPCGARSSWRPR